jgi:hypothetical protein
VEDVVADHSMVGPGRAGRWHLVRRVGSPAWSCPEGLAEAHGRVRARRQREARAALLLVEGDGRTHAVPPTPRRAHRRRRGGAARAGRCRTSQRPHTRSDGPRPTSSPRAVGSREVREPRWRAPGWARRSRLPGRSDRSCPPRTLRAPPSPPGSCGQTGAGGRREVVFLAGPDAQVNSRTLRGMVPWVDPADLGLPLVLQPQFVRYVVLDGGSGLRVRGVGGVVARSTMSAGGCGWGCGSEVPGDVGSRRG